LTVWQAVASLAGLASALTAFGLGLAAFVRSGRAEDARERADAASSSAAASQVGLEYLRESLRAQQETITRQEGEIGELRGRLRECREERQAMAVQIAELQERMP
jgi:predicted RNase H-like nuclease (RuvC/YqgF family)